MDLERLSVRLRPRNAWEGLDLGFPVARRRARSIYAAWFAVFLPVAITAIFLLRDEVLWAWILLWWLKPLFDRVVLEVLASGLFGEEAPIAAIVRGLPATLWRSGIVGALTWRRFDFARSLHLPVYQLERLRGREARRRIATLDREARPAAVWLTILLANMEFLYLFGASLFVMLLAPVQVPLDMLAEAWWRGQFAGSSAALRGTLLAALAMSLIEPLYVACGFTLYLQRRTALEGWDIELRFRQLASRVASAASPPVAATTSAVAATCIAVCLGLACISPPARADEPSRAAREIRNVLAQPEFGHEEHVRRLHYVGPEWKPKASEGKPTDWRWLMEWFQVAARAVRGLAWVAAVFAVAFVLYHIAKQVRLRGRSRVPGPRPDFLFGLDVRPESLPADVAAAAEAFARKGAMRDALSLLYRASLVRFLDEGVEFLRSDTEGDCLKRASRAARPARRAYFERLVAAWRLLAYGHREIGAAEAIAFAEEWRRHFDAPDAASPGASPQPA